MARAVTAVILIIMRSMTILSRRNQMNFTQAETGYESSSLSLLFVEFVEFIENDSLG